MRRIVIGTALLGLMAASGCGNAVGDITSAGLTGVSVDSAGDVSVVSYVCGDGVTDVVVSRDRAGLKETEENEVVATYVSSTDLRGLVSLRLAAPARRWTPSTPADLEPGKGYLISAGGTKEDSAETGQVYVMTDQLDALEPGRIYTSGESDTATLEPQSEADFIEKAKTACSS